MKDILTYLSNNKLLNRQYAKQILLDIATNKYNDFEITAFISMFLMRSISIQEIQGFRDALLELYIPINFNGIPIMDIVGTGGDGKNTFNISTAACFVVASMGHPVVKHGNYGASSICGSSNVMEQLGYTFKNDENLLKYEVEKANICFLHAPLFHPALKTVAPIRKSIKIRTFFNLLGPLVNPANPYFQMIGVYNLEIARMYQYILQENKSSFTIVHCLNGYDEISLTNDTKIINNMGEFIFNPSELSNQIVHPTSIEGGENIETAKNIFLQIMEGNGTAEQNAVVIANAATAAFMTKKYTSYQEAYHFASECLLSGKTNNILKNLIQLQ